MKKFIFLPFIAFALMCSCSAKNTSQVSADENNKTVAAQTQKSDSVIKGSLDKNGKVVITEMNFKKGSAEVSEESESSIKELADYLKENTSITMNVACYTDEDGSPAYCIDLSNKRAQNISEQLKKHGVEGSRVNVTGEGWKPGKLPEEKGERMEIELIH